MGNTSIEWTGKTWNPLKAKLKKDTLSPTKANPLRVIPAGKVGYHCERISPGCCECYACAGNARTLPAWGTGLDYTVPNRDNVQLFLDIDVLYQPFLWKKPTKIFPCSMTDWAADFVSDEMMDQMLAVGVLTPQHTYQFLTKRADRLLKWATRSRLRERILAAAFNTFNRSQGFESRWEAAITRWPWQNIHLGFSAEDQPNFDARWEHMRQLAAAGWFVWCSYEPALGPIDFSKALREGLAWVVVGGESGPRARPFNIQWARNTIAACKAAGVACFVKQLGSRPVQERDTKGDFHPWLLIDKKGGSTEEWTEDLRIREFPNVKPLRLAADAQEEFTVWCRNWPASGNGRIWTRNSLKGAKALADTILERTGELAYVYSTEAYNMRRWSDPIYVSEKEPSNA